jgi:ABC-type sugar transport system ATPase subunit
MRAFLLQIRKDFEIPGMLVIHDVVEAYTMPDALIGYVNGMVVQKGSPLEVFSNPFTEEVKEPVLARDKCRIDTVSGH